MLLQPAPSIHTAFMRFDFDVVFLDANLHVVRTVPHLKPFRAVSARRAHSVLELAAGEINRRGVELGDQVVVADPEVGFGLADPDEVAAAAAAEAQQVPEEPGVPRVLLIGADRRFRSVAATLLERRGYIVTADEHITNVVEIAARERVDVVVVDAGALPAVATLEATRLEAVNPRLGFVVVSDSVTQTTATPVLPKWGSFDSLMEAIEDVRAARTQA